MLVLLYYPLLQWLNGDTTVKYAWLWIKSILGFTGLLNLWHVNLSAYFKM